MKKLIILLSIMAISISLISMDIIQMDKNISVSLDKLKTYDQVEFSTHRVKDGEEKDDLWSGVPLMTLLTDLGIENYSIIKVIANDNYMVRYEVGDISPEDPVIAIKRNGKDLTEETVRLVAPSRRDMFWIQNIAKIQTEEPTTMSHPEVLYRAETLMANLTIQNNPKPFVDVDGYFLRDVMSQVFPSLTGEFLLMGIDGVRHLLNYSSYLSEAVLIIDNDSFYMKSPQMPGGMWIQQIAYIQQDDTAIIFTGTAKKLENLGEHLHWNEIPETMKTYHGDKTGEINARTLLDNDDFYDLEKIEW